MKELFYTSKAINPNNYIEIGIDDDYPVLFVYKDGKLFDCHFSTGTTFEAEMKNTIDCYIHVHNAEPSIGDILTWRKWLSILKDNELIS